MGFTTWTNGAKVANIRRFSAPLDEMLMSASEACREIADEAYERGDRETAARFNAASDRLADNWSAFVCGFDSVSDWMEAYRAGAYRGSVWYALKGIPELSDFLGRK